MTEYKLTHHDCPVTYTLSVLGGKWKWLIIYTLSGEGTLRYGELKRNLPGITHKMLSQELKGLEAEQLIDRKEYHQIPPKVEYSLTKKAQTLIPILDLMCDWGKTNWPKANPGC
ncbi:winged helix-turn-helix transcriptional regulator [Methylomusa anaerophila]|uniref:Putative HTH-type transcriptional regulator YybR n=1 Tax=Methylomusa anaerophila TaxID=1930071 RepID=A0A348AR11_9FIRM|nr:helix-turn-helix domain-containing protein [Methylomusa anaerophila]BBB93509.1 putative HTH-type transcriptional regulator YybR [Methylomusa anaerophila]